MKKMTKKISVEISYKTILFILFLSVSLWLVYQIKDILFLFFISLILVGALNPTVTSIERRKVPRWVAILSIYLILLIFLFGVLAGVVPPLAQQVSEFVRTFPSIVQKVGLLSITPDLIASQMKELVVLPSGILRFTFSIFSNLLAVIAVLVLAFYLLLEHENLGGYLLDLFGKEGEEKGKRIIRKLESSLGSWVRAEIILMTFVGVLSYFGFLLLGLNFALPLALLAGILEIIPNIGPIVAAFPAAFLGFLASPFLGLATIFWCTLVQQVENNFLVPRVMRKTVGINPVITLLSLAVGLRLAGIGGAILAIPVYLTIKIFLAELVFNSERQTKAS